MARYLFALTAIICSNVSSASIYNLKIVTDANPDYSDLPSLVHSATSNSKTPEEKCWAMFYWNHIARRQTEPMILHGMALTDPIRQFNDYGYTMCSTISGINQSIWEQMGLKHRYWDISNHTVGEVFYDGRWHMYDNSMSAIYTLCDGHTIASVEDIGAEGACEASGWKKEPGHIAKYHCLTSTSPNGFLTGADTARSLEEEYHCFNPNGLKLRTYFYDWDNGHRYILNLNRHTIFSRAYFPGKKEPGNYVPNHDKDPEQVNLRYRLRANGDWMFSASLTPNTDWQGGAHSFSNITSSKSGLHPENSQQPSVVIYKIDSANVTTSQRITARFARKNDADQLSISISTTNGLHWKEVWKSENNDAVSANLNLVDEVNGAYEILVRIQLFSAGAPEDVVLRELNIDTTTALNSKTLPQLNLGKNTVYVGAGEQTESIVLWPELQGDKYKQLITEEKNVASIKNHNGYQGAIYPTKAKEDSYIVYRIETPRDLTRLTYGGRFYNRAPKSRIELLHSLDNGQTWTKSWSLTDTAQPWDVIHYQTIEIRPGHRSVLVKYLMNSPTPSHDACSIYALRMEANHLPTEKPSHGVKVSFHWDEKHGDHWEGRSHTQLVSRLPFKYTINVGGDDHPQMSFVQMSLNDGGIDNDILDEGYGLGKDPGGEKFIPTWQTLGHNLAVGKKYTLSHASKTTWDAGDPDGTKLTDGVVGPTYVGGPSYRYGALWDAKTNPTITLDLGEKKSCASFGLNFHGYPWHDSLKGEIKDIVAVQISDDGKNFVSVGRLKTDLHRKDIPVNFMLPDDESLAGHTFRVIPDKPLFTRYVRFLITSDRSFCATEIEVLDSIDLKPFDLRIALPDERP
jgi:hypothetical protein